jgi:hypothetical protein
VLEILALIFLGKMAGGTAEKKGHSSVIFAFLAIFLWIVGEVGGIGLAYSHDKSSMGAVYGLGIMGALGGGFLGLLIPACLPDRSRGNWKPREEFDIFGHPIRTSRGPARNKKPVKKRRPRREEDDYENEERRRRRSERYDDEEDEYDDRRRRRARRDEDDEPPRRRVERLEEVEDDEPPRRRPRREDDEPPPRRRRP